MTNEFPDDISNEIPDHLPSYLSATNAVYRGGEVSFTDTEAIPDYSVLPADRMALVGQLDGSIGLLVESTIFGVPMRMAYAMADVEELRFFRDQVTKIIDAKDAEAAADKKDN